MFFSLYFEFSRRLKVLRLPQKNNFAKNSFYEISISLALFVVLPFAKERAEEERQKGEMKAGGGD